MAERPPYRLPDTVTPERYELEITPDLTAGRFHGIARITVNVREPVRDMVLNALDLAIHDVQLSGPDGRQRSGTFAYRPDEEQLVLTWPQTINPGRWTLTIQYEGELGHDLRGFYRTTVKGPDGTTTMIASTQCEASDARQIFPGWDEPAFKAVYSITLVVDKGMTALSNGREIASETIAPDKRRVTFADTIPMSSYLVAMVVGPYEWTEPTFVGKTPVRIAARQGYQHLTAFAAEAAHDALQFFEQYFAIPYAGDKLDHVAIPEFEAGAMENLGLVTYREEYLLLDPKRASQAEQTNLVSVIAHETAHMWFGDLVTMRWWNGLWLNEAFATFMQILATDALHPEWEPWTTFSHGRAYAMTIDGLQSTRAIEFPVGRPSESWAMFDVLTYEKGAAVLRMLEQYLGPETFRQGISQYLKTHRFGNTETSDLWDALESASGQPVRSMMDTWVFQAGYPIVRVQWNQQDGQLVVSQRQFRYHGTGPGQWQVPVTIGIRRQKGSRETVRLVLDDRPQVISVPDDWGWININDGGWGFYRVTYDETLWKPLVNSIASLTAIERFQIVDDAWAAVLADEAPLSQTVQLWRALASERDPDVWSTVSKHLGMLDVMADANDRKALQSLIQAIAQPALEALGFEPRPDEEGRLSRLRGVLVNLLGTIGADPAVREEAKQLWHLHIKGDEAPPDLLTPLVNVVATTGNATDWEALYTAFKNARTPQDETRYLFALARFSDPDLILRTLTLYGSDEVRLQFGAIALGQALMNRHASGLTWDMIETHWDELLKKYPKNMMKHIVQARPFIVDAVLADRITNWFTTHPIEEVARLIDQTKELQGINQALAHRVRGRLATLLS